MHALQPTAASSLSLLSGTYIYAIAEVPSSSAGRRQFAAISSDDSLRIFDGQSLQPLTVVSAKTHEGVTSLNGTLPGFLATAGRDGAVRLWDVRSGHSSGKADVEMKVGMFFSLASIAPSIMSLFVG
jgi:WD40 repeat protein